MFSRESAVDSGDLVRDEEKKFFSRPAARPR
jgi:hypothetical protein